MAELIVGSFVQSLAGNALSSLFDEIGLSRRVKLEFNKLVATLSLIRGYLQDAEKRQVDDEALKCWLKQLQDLAYETDDLLDDFNTEAIRRRSVAGGRKKMVNEVSIFFSSSNQLIYANRMAHRIKDLKEKLDFLRNLAGLFNLESVSKSPSLKERHHRRPLTVPSDYERYVVGRDEDKKKVIKFLLDPNFEENLSILPIVGFGGMGKTTLAREVFINEVVKEHFEATIWVYVSTNFVVEEILQKIVGPCSEQGDKLHEKLEKELDGKKYLLVLDDVWNEKYNEWKTLKRRLPPGAEGSKMLVTTRSPVVANIVANTIDKKQLKLKGLNEEESLTLLMRMAGEKDDEWKNQEIEKKIQEKCCGVPLAIMTIGRLLSTRLGNAKWSDLPKDDFSRIEQSDDDIMPTLKISYDFLPSHLKQCFAYCCLFPKDYELDPNELVRLWMAQGFILKSPGKTLHDVGKEYFMELASRSFFQDFEKDKLGNIKRCKMHDLMHDLAIMVAGGSCTTIINNGSSASQEDIPEEVRHVSMVVDMKSYNLDDLGPNQQIRRSLLFINQHQEINSFSGDVSSFRNLRALRLHRLAKGDVLRSIGKLKHLRSLDLSDSDKLTSLPISIGKLLNLETLILYGCKKLESLPREVTKLVNLRYLDMGGCDSLTCTPSGMGNLTNLEVLRSFRVGEIGNWNAARMNELGRLTGLEELSIEYLGREKKESDGISTGDADSTANFWIDKLPLQRLHLSWGRRGAYDPSEYAEKVLEKLKPNLGLLKSFTIEEYPGTTLASWTGELYNLVEINLYNYDCICKTDGSLYPKSIPPLDQLPSLKSIELKNMGNLEWIEVTENSICLYPSLEVIELDGLPMLKGWKRKRMDVNRSGDQTIHSSSPFFIPSFSKKVQVRIDDCRMLCYTWNDKKGVSLGGMKCKDLEELWNRSNVEETSSISTTLMGTLTFVPLSSVPLHTVTSLDLRNLEDTEELPSELFQSLSSLQSLHITKCHHIRSIPPLDQFSSLESIELINLQDLEWIEVTENSNYCPSLKKLSLLCLPMFKGWKRMRGDQSIHSSSSSLFFIPSFSGKIDVKVRYCKMLCHKWNDSEWLILSRMKYKDLEELSRRNVEEESSTTRKGSLTLLPLSSVPLHKLRSLTLGHLDDTEELPMDLFQSLSRLQSLKITDCHRLKALSGWAILQYLRSLESLDIRNSMDQEEDNKAIQGTPNFQTKMRHLTLIGMDKMKTLPPWIQYLPKLEILLLQECENMETLPGWFSQLTSLKMLKVTKCGELSRKCQRDTGEYWSRISHIEHVYIPYEEEAA